MLGNTFDALRIVAAESFGKTPGEFDRACECGDVRFDDVMRLFKLRMLSSANPLGFGEFVFPGLNEQLEQERSAQKAAEAFDKIWQGIEQKRQADGTADNSES